MSSLQLILPEAVSQAVEKAFLMELRSKMFASAALLVKSVRAIQTKYGAEGVEAIHQALTELASEKGRKMAQEANADTLPAFCSALEARCTGSHEWFKLEDSDKRQAYRFTRCIWAEIFAELDALDIGFWLCEGDEPISSAFNPAIGFQRTKTLMEGDDCCDHIFYLKDRA
jgi:hypothetical protein